jgi:uracil-DNA glycosylase
VQAQIKQERRTWLSGGFGAQIDMTIKTNSHSISTAEAGGIRSPVSGQQEGDTSTSGEIVSAHFWPGSVGNTIVFILSCPGEEEMKAGRPAAGKTGENMDGILSFLNVIDRNLFPSNDRYHYRITNASKEIIFAAEDSTLTEDARLNITIRTNIARVRREIGTCEVVILCGKRAHLLEPFLLDKKIAKTPHLGDKGLRNEYLNSSPVLKGIKSGHDRDVARKKLCAEEIREQLKQVGDSE